MREPGGPSGAVCSDLSTLPPPPLPSSLLLSRVHLLVPSRILGLLEWRVGEMCGLLWTGEKEGDREQVGPLGVDWGGSYFKSLRPSFFSPFGEPECEVAGGGRGPCLIGVQPRSTLPMQIDFEKSSEYL